MLRIWFYNLRDFCHFYVKLSSWWLLLHDFRSWGLSIISCSRQRKQKRRCSLHYDRMIHYMRKTFTVLFYLSADASRFPPAASTGWWWQLCFLKTQTWTLELVLMKSVNFKHKHTFIWTLLWLRCCFPCRMCVCVPVHICVTVTNNLSECWRDCRKRRRRRKMKTIRKKADRTSAPSAYDNWLDVFIFNTVIWHPATWAWKEVDLKL